MRKLLIISLLISFLASCSMPETKIYTLYIPPEKVQTYNQSNASVVIIATSPKYLAQPYMVYRNSPYQLEISSYSRWYSSPVKMVKEVFNDALLSTGLFGEVRKANSTPNGFYSLHINLKKFERFTTSNTSFGELVFDVEFRSPEGKVLYTGTISKKVKLDDETFLSFARGISTALAEGVNEVKTKIILSISSQIQQ